MPFSSSSIASFNATNLLYDDLRKAAKGLIADVALSASDASTKVCTIFHTTRSAQIAGAKFLYHLSNIMPGSKYQITLIACLGYRR